MKKYVISSYIPNAKLDRKFLRSLKKYCEVNKAELILIPCKPNYKDDFERNKEILEYSRNETIQLNNKLQIANIAINGNVLDPISGLDPIASTNGNLIIPFPRHRFKMVPRSLKNHKTPVGIWCTGTISKPYYKDTKTGIYVNQIHQKGALVVEIIDNDKFNIRQLQCNSTKGIFHDLDKKYYPHKVVKSYISGILCGDLHPPFVDKKALSKTLDFIKKYTPKTIALADTLDSVSISHHLEGKFIDKSTNHIKSLKEELLLTANILKLFFKNSPNSKFVVVKSNHDQHLERYINEFRFKEDYVNLELSLEIALEYVREKHGKKTDLVKFALNKFTDLKNFKFLKEHDTYSISGVEISNHGHSGNNGAKGTTTSQGLLFGKNSASGHTHSPEIGVHGNFVAGTLTTLVMPYTKDSGGSSWMHSHVVIYPNGTKTHIHIV